MQEFHKLIAIMSQQILGLDLGTYAVRAMLLERRFHDFEVLYFTEQPVHQHTRLTHAEAVVLALEQILKERPDLAQVDVVSAALPGYFISERLIEMPGAHNKRLAQMVTFELEGHIPTDIDTLVVDSHVLDRGVEQSKVLALYFEERKLAEYLDGLGRVGLDPRYLGADLIDLSAAAQVGIFPREGYYALCDVGHSKTSLCIMQGTELKYARTIGVGGVHFTKAIQRTFNLNQEKAEALKHSRGKIVVKTGESDQISRILSDVAAELVSNIRQTFIGFDGFFGKQNKAALYVTGGGIRLAGLVEYLSFHLRMNVLEMDPLALVSHRLEDVEEKSLNMAQVVGSAVRPIFTNRLPRLNFRKGAYVYKQDIQKVTSELKTTLVFFAMILFLGVGYYFYANSYYSGKIALLEKKVAKMIASEFPDFASSSGKARGKTSRGQLDRQLKSAKSKLASIKSQVESLTGQAGASPLEVMQEISQKLPLKKEVVMEVSEMNYSDGFISLKSRTNDPRNPLKIVEALKTSKIFTDVKTTDPQQKPGDLYDFVVTIDMKGQ